jgi:pyruvate kinase
VAVGDRLLLDDGRLELEVTRVDGGRVRTSVVTGGTLRGRTGLAVAGKELPFPAMTRADRRKLALAVDSGADWIGVSMAQGARQVQAVRRALARLGAPQVKVVAKIESRSGLANLDEIIDSADAVMIARGDLVVAVGADRLPAVQARIAARVRARGKELVIATNFLSRMLTEAAPSAANLRDVARARRQGPRWLMLNETAISPHPVEAVRVLGAALDPGGAP